VIQLFASSSDRPSRLKRLLTGGIVATVLGGLLATGMTSVASAAPVTGLTVNVVADGVVVPNILVEVYKANDDYKYSLAEATTDTSGSAVFELDNDLVVGDEYVVAVSKTYSTPGAFATFSNGFVDGTSATLVDDAQSAAPVVLAGATVRTVALNAGAVITGSVFAPNGDDFEDQGTSITAYRKSVNMDSGAVQWDYEGQAGTIEVTEDEEGQPVGNLTNDFTLNGLRAGDYVLSFTQNGQPTWVSTIFNGGASGINTATPVAITRDAATTINGDFLFGESISGTVTIPEVTDIPENQFGVSATLLNSDGTLDDITGGGSASVNPDGSYSITGLAFGSYAVHFDVYDDADFYGEWYNNAATSGSATPVASGSIGIDAEIGDGFTLTVLADSGNGAIEGAKVSLRGAETNELYNLVTGYNGKAVFTNVAPDAYTVTVEHPDFDPDNPDERYSTRYVTSTDIGSADWRDALLVAGVNEELSVGVKFAGSAIATVTVLDPTGKPLTTRGSSVVAEVISGGDLVRSAKRVNGFPVAGKPGVFTLDLDTETDYAISVDPDLATSYPQFLGGEPAGSDDYSNVTPFYSGTEDFALTFGLVSGGKISGVVKSTAGKAILEVGVDIFQFNGSDWVRVVGTRTSKTGAYSVAVEPGSYKVGFNAQESSSGLLSTYFTGYTEIEALPTVYVGKSATAVINGSLAPAGSITGTATKLSGSKAVAAASIIVRPIRINDMFSRTVFAAQAGFTNAKGQFTITGLPAGTYELSFEDNSAVLGDVYSPAAAGTTYVVVAGKAKAAGSILLPTAAATRTAIVTGSLSASVPGAQGTVEFQSEDGLYYSVAEITGSGQFTTKLVPGVYNYTATFKGSAPLKYRGVVDTGLHFEQGPNTLEIPAIIKTPLAFETNPTIWTDFDLPVAVDGAYLQVDAQWDAVRAKATYQWLRDGIPIYGETNAYHQPTNADAGSMVAVRVTLDNKFGLYSGSYETIRATSEGVYVPFEGQVSNGGVELIAGPLGRVPGSVLTANTFAWADGTSLSYTWLREGQEIEGVTSPTYTVQPGDIGLPITVVVQGHRPGYEASGNIAANSVTIQPNAGATNVKKPTVTSTTKGAPAGTVKYTVTPGTWSVAGTTPAYTWYLDAEPQDNGTNSFLLPTTETRALYVEVSATKTGYIQSQPVAVLARKGTALPTGGATVYDNRTDDEVYADDTVYVGTKFYLEYNYGVIAGAVNPATFQWQRKTGTTWAAIAKATASTYTVTTADAGKALQVVVKASSTYYGTATTVVAAGTAALDPELKFDRADSVSVSGTGVVSSTLTAVIDSEGFEIAGAAVAYQWGTQAGDVFTPIAKATKSTFVIPANLLGKEIRVRVTSTKAGYEPSVERSLGVLATTGTITVVSNVDITGSANVGSKLTAKPAVTDVTGTKRTYLWERFDGEEGEWDAVAQTATYTPTAALRGSELRVTETITKAAHDTVSSEKTVVIGYGVATVKTAPKVTTAATTYKVSAGVSTPAATPTYQWIVAGEEVEEYSATYMRNPSDAGKLIAVEVSYSVPGFETKVVYLVAQKAAAPVLGGPLVLDGAQVGTASVADNQLAAPVEVVGSTINPTYTFQWLLSGKAIKGATKESYVPLAAQVGKPLSVKITSTSIEHVTATWTSAATTVAKGAPAAEGVVYSGSYWGFVGATFVATVETPQPGYTVSYQWFRKAFSSSSSPVAIAKATTLSYKTVLADQDAAVSLVVTYKRSGYEDKVYTAATVDIYGENGLYALSAPVVSGSGAVGTPLTVSTGIWTFTPTLTYQWKRNGIEIPGVTGTSYTPQGDHLGDVISVYVVAKRAGFDSNYANSNEVKVVRGAAPTATGVNAPKVTGRAATCSTLTATPGVWSLDGVQLSYQWYLHGDGDYAVPGATKSTYATEPSSLGARVFVRVTATRDGYAVGTADSVLTAALTEGC
jgi:hypothetical protein